MSFKLKPEVSVDFRGPTEHWTVRLTNDATGRSEEGHASSFAEAYNDAVDKLVGHTSADTADPIPS